MAFPNDFVWGAATASYQIEGATRQDGRGDSVWDMFCRKPGAVFQGHTGDVACDHYHHYEQDVALMRELGINAYRFSVAWPRVMPTGVCDVEPKGVAFYDRLVDSLLEAGITPWATLFHWDFPLALYRQGGWLNRESADWFADYTRVVVDALSDRVQHWMTLNEPQCYIGLGLQEGKHAPGDRLRWSEVLLAAHNTLLAHGKAVQVIRSHAKRAPQVGIAPTPPIFVPATDGPEDVRVAREATFAVSARSAWNTSWWMDPICLGQYPEDGLRLFADELPNIEDGDLETIAQPLDFFAQNIYHGTVVRAGSEGMEVVSAKAGAPATALKWPVVPEALYWGARFMHERYGLPIVVTENGLANQDWLTLDGKVHDPQRIDYTRRYLRELRRAHEEGIPVLGYFHWSLMDNFEWAEGYRERFGLIYVDYETQERVPKDSFYWYRDVIRSNGANL